MRKVHIRFVQSVKEVTWTKFFATVIMLAAFFAVLSVTFVPSTSSCASAMSAEWTEHDAIVINDDSAFTSANGVVSGNGTKLDPYIIKGWKIGPFPNSTAINVWNTNAHFRIRNVYAFSCSIGVLMNNVSNGWVENSQFISNSLGVGFYKSDSCKVVGSTFEGSDVAILISFSDVSQSDNTFINNDINVAKYKRDVQWELSWVGATVCIVIFVPLVTIVVMLIYFRFRRFPPPAQ